jgi:hypothetical protein
VQPYVIRQGDYLLKVAYENGFDADTVWGSSKNADLRMLRRDPNILAPGDVLYVPDPPDPPKSTALSTGSTNSFVSPAPQTPVTVKFSEPRLVSQACTIAELPDLIGLSTDGNGVLTFQAPVSLETVTIALVDASPAVTFTCELGHLDPIDTLSGVFQRLQNLGYIDDDAEFEQDDLDLLRGGLNALKISIVGPPSGLALSRAAVSDSGSDAPQAGDYAASNDDTPASDPGPSSSGPSVPPKLAPRGLFGLSDDGILDEDTTQMLRIAHGC